MKTAVQWLEEYLNTKVLPCPEGNDYVYGMNVAHENLINYVIPALLEKEKEQIKNAFDNGVYHSFYGSADSDKKFEGEDYYNTEFN